MRLVDELFELYRDQLSDEEDLDMIAFSVLEHCNHKQLLGIVEEMNKEELAYFIRLFLLETLKEKLDNSDKQRDELSSSAKYLH